MLDRMLDIPNRTEVDKPYYYYRGLLFIVRFGIGSMLDMSNVQHCLQMSNILAPSTSPKYDPCRP
jgi:hypothetical protein